MQLSGATKDILDGKWQLVDAGKLEMHLRSPQKVYLLRERRCAWETALAQVQVRNGRAPHPRCTSCLASA